MSTSRSSYGFHPLEHRGKARDRPLGRNHRRRRRRQRQRQRNATSVEPLLYVYLRFFDAKCRHARTRTQNRARAFFSPTNANDITSGNF
uniref:Uncharacterized protein n=1 Tax=Trichogramma kaykai TaxID=54128 RepID=A0ABD2WZ13_9HYME